QARERHRVRPRRLSLHQGSEPRHARVRAARLRHDRAQPRARLRSGGAVRRHEAIGDRPRGRARGADGVPRDPVRLADVGSGRGGDGAAGRFLGAWRYVGSLVDGKPRPDRGEHPKGIIHYDPSGHMSVQVAPDKERKKAGGEPTPEEAKAALAGYIAYFGTYTVDAPARPVPPHRLGSVQPGDPADVVRGYEFVGDRLILRPVGTTAEVIWERIR